MASLESGDWRNTSPRFQGDNLARNRERTGQLQALADSWGATPAQLALAWLLHQGDDVVPIPGTRRSARLEENVGATSLRLSAEQLAQLNELFPPGVAAGERYSPEMMKTVNL